MTSRENQEYNPLLRGQFLRTIIPYCLGEFYPWVISSSILMTCMLHYNNRLIIARRNEITFTVGACKG